MGVELVGIQNNCILIRKLMMYGEMYLANQRQAHRVSASHDIIGRQLYSFKWKSVYVYSAPSSPPLACTSLSCFLNVTFKNKQTRSPNQMGYYSFKIGKYWVIK